MTSDDLNDVTIILLILGTMQCHCFFFFLVLLLLSTAYIAYSLHGIRKKSCEMTLLPQCTLNLSLEDIT